MISVANFAIEIGVTTQSLNSKIRKLSLELETNPINQKQRLLNPEQCQLLREHYPRHNQAQTVNPSPQTDFEYQRPTEIGLVLAQRSIAIGSVNFAHRNPLDNPLLQRMRSKLEGMQEQNDLALKQLTQANNAELDLKTALDAYEQLGIVEDAQAKADRNFLLEQQAYSDRLEKLRVAKFDLENPAPAPKTNDAPVKQNQPVNREYPF